MKFDIKAVVMDVDGVIVGDKINYNSPSPTKEILKALEIVKSNGCIVSLCTGKPYLAIQKIVKESALYNLHITDGGGVMMDPVTETMLVKNVVNKEFASKVINAFISNNTYMEFYTDTNYYIQKSQKNDITAKHSKVLIKPPKMVSSLELESHEHEIIKLMIIAKNESEVPALQALFDKHFKDKLNLRWGLHPVINPLQFGVITEKGISKGQMLLNMIKEYDISANNVLSIGDSDSDWDFMQHCGYVAAPDNVQDQLRDFINSKKNHGYIGPHVDQNGLIDIFKHFELL